METPSNLLFATALLVLLLVCIQLSAEISELEEETRTLTEEVALLRLDVEQRLADAGKAPASDETGGHGPDEATPGS